MRDPHEVAREVERQLDAVVQGLLVRDPYYDRLHITVETGVNRADQVEGGLRVTGFPKEMEDDHLFEFIDKVQLSLQERFTLEFTRLSWALYYRTPDGIDSPDFRFRGMEGAQTGFFAANYTKLAMLGATAKEVHRNVTSRHDDPVLPRQIDLRVFWSPQSEQPKFGHRPKPRR